MKQAKQIKAVDLCGLTEFHVESVSAYRWFGAAQLSRQSQARIMFRIA